MDSDTDSWDARNDIGNDSKVSENDFDAGQSALDSASSTIEDTMEDDFGTQSYGISGDDTNSDYEVDEVQSMESLQTIAH